MKNLEYDVKFIPVKCKCGHTVNFVRKKKLICRWCGKMVYFDDKEKFKDKMKVMIGKK